MRLFNWKGICGYFHSFLIEEFVGFFIGSSFEIVVINSIGFKKRIGESLRIWGVVRKFEESKLSFLSSQYYLCD